MASQSFLVIKLFSHIRRMSFTLSSHWTTQHYTWDKLDFLFFSAIHFSSDALRVQSFIDFGMFWSHNAIKKRERKFIHVYLFTFWMFITSLISITKCKLSCKAIDGRMPDTTYFQERKRGDMLNSKS